jgi:serine/threonine-protein kinase
MSSEPTKAILGTPSPMDGSHARNLVEKALEARRGGRLGDAADLMEEAFNKSPDLRNKYAHQVKLWRCGVSM